MPSALRSRAALFGLVGAFMIPIGMSSLGGYTHVRTCEEVADQPFSVFIAEGQAPVVTTSTRIVKGAKPKDLCGGLQVQMGASISAADRVTIEVPITNTTDVTWRGTVELRLGNTSIPVDVGEVGPGQTATDRVEITLEDGQHELSGSLVIGP